ncbi:hypothetical protein IMSAGC013_03722 [Lachnospiraceae bacterium]|nr:hypothetical protein IMSAGC013_03722 [Lachnospiraceae bacterium]
MKKIKELITSCREVLAYLFFGVCTTLVNIIVYYICRKLGTDTTAGTVTAWILSVLFAYVTNRRWVFESRADSAIGIVREGLSFFPAVWPPESWIWQLWYSLWICCIKMTC